MKILSNLSENEKGKIESIDTTHLGIEFTRDLLDYGLIPGSEITILKIHKGSGKLILLINGAEIALRLEDAKKIHIN